MATETDSTSRPFPLRVTSGLTAGPGSCNDGQMRIVTVESTDLFVGTAQRPLQVVRVTLVNEEPAATSATIGVQGPGVRNPGPFGINELDPGEQRAFEVPVEIAAPYQPGSTRRVKVTVDSHGERSACLDELASGS